MSDDMAANLARLFGRTVAAIPAGLAQGAAIIQQSMVDTDAYAGMSGATRASSLAYVATAENPNGDEPEKAYNAAAGKLQGFAGHAGKPYLTDAPGPGPGAAMIVATVPTDYIQDLELEGAGEKAFVGDAVAQDAPQAFDAVVQALRGVWR